MLVARLLLAGAVALALAACGGSGGGTATTAAATTEAVTACKDVAQPAAKPGGGQTAPTEPLAAGRTYTLTVTTSCGGFTVTLDPGLAPKTTASLVSLARAGFFDGTTFHRIVPGFVIQGGDPTQSGEGGPGYQTVDKPPAGARYVKGVVAMAKTPTEPTGTAGSQFFVVTAEDAALPPDYAIVGKVTAGYDTVVRIEQAGDPATDRPRQPVVIEKVTVGES